MSHELVCSHSFCKKSLKNFKDGKRKDDLNCFVCRCRFTLDEGKILLYYQIKILLYFVYPLS